MFLVGLKAINNTTVEVTYKDAVEDVKALNFTIEGLKVESAVVKQTDAKTVVLTTSVQEGNKEYTVKESDAIIGKFTGISAVLPTGITVTTPSVQGTIGKEVTVSAQVTVPEGQAKAGIPVTFNIVNDNSNLNSKIEVVAYTDANGVASHSYTRYYEHNDSVVAYATQKSSHVSHGKVYWAQALSVTEVTEGNTLTNGAKKVYKIKAKGYNNGYANVTFKENVNVNPDKLVTAVTATDVAYGEGKYPYQVTTGGKEEVRVKLDANGEATFTLTGVNASVTPIVFIDGYFDNTQWKTGDGKLGVQELQAEAPTLKFELNHTLGLNIKALANQRAAAITGKGDGGRDYEITLTDVKTGKIAPEGTRVSVVFPEGSISSDKAVYLDDKRVVAGVAQDLYIGKDGKVAFTLTGQKDGFATPTVFVDNDSKPGLSKDDLQTVGEATYFVDAIVNTSVLTIKDKAGKKVTTVASSEPATFEYKSVDQNGFDYYAGNGDYEVTYQVSPQFADVVVSGNGLASTTVKKGTTASVKVWATNGVASLRVVSADTAIASSVTVSASSSQITLEDQPATVDFAKYSASEKTGVATAVDTAKDELTIDGVLYSYVGATYKYQGSTITKAAFEGYIGGNLATVSVTKDAEGKLTFDVLSVGAAASTKEALLSAIISAEALYNGSTEGSAEGQYAVGSRADLNTAISAAKTVYSNAYATSTQIATANADLAKAVETFKGKVVGNQKTALTTKSAEAKALVTGKTGVTAAVMGAAGNKQGEVTDTKLAALNSQITLADSILAMNGATSSDYAAVLGTLTTAFNNVKSEVDAYASAKKSLTDSITIAERAVAEHTVGNGNGQVAGVDSLTLKTAIIDAQVVANTATTTQASFGTAKTAIDTAKTTFDGKLHAHTVAISGTSTSVVLTFTTAVSGTPGTAGDVIADTTVVTLAAGTTATATAVATAGDEITVTVTSGPVLDDTIVVPVTINGVAVKLTLVFDGAAWEVTSQDPANFVEVQ